MTEKEYPISHEMKKRTYFLYHRIIESSVCVCVWGGGGGGGVFNSNSITGAQGAVSIRKTVLPGMAIPMLKIRRPNGRLIFNMEIAIRR